MWGVTHSTGGSSGIYSVVDCEDDDNHCRYTTDDLMYAGDGRSGVVTCIPCLAYRAPR